MALIIKWDMPKSCSVCPIVDNNMCDVWYNHNWTEGRPSTCPILGEFPDVHGRLIDADALPIVGITDYKMEGHTVVEYEDLLNAPTVVEASK